MSLWERLNSILGAEQIKAFYNDTFPIEIRELCAKWIEEQIFGNQCIDVNDPQYNQFPTNFITGLIQQLDYESARLKPSELVIRMKINDARNHFTRNIHPGLYRHICDTLQMEQNFVTEYEKSAQIGYVDNEVLEINEKIKQLREMTTKNNDNGNQYRKEVEKHLLDNDKRNMHLQQANNVEKTARNVERYELLKAHYRGAMKKEEIGINVKCHELLNAIGETIKLHDEVQTVVIHNRLSTWKRAQVWTGKNEGLPHTGLDQLQQWFEALAENIWSTRSLTDSMRSGRHIPFNGFNINEKFEEDFRKTNTILHNLILSSFIVEKQPTQVLKTHTR